MSVRISSLASTQITNHDVKQFMQCKMYDANDVYLTDLAIISPSYNHSRDFGVSVMNLAINNSGGKHDKGALYEIMSDYKVVLIEGYDTGVETDKFPKFKGYVKDVTTSIDRGDSVINVTVYDELILTQRSDLNKKFVATTTLVSGEIFTPVVDNPLGIIDGDPVGARLRITYTKDNVALSGLMSADHFYVGDDILSNELVSITPNGSKLGMLFYSGLITGTLSADDVLVNQDGSYRAVVDTAVNGTYTPTSESTIVIKVDANNLPAGNFGNGDTLYVESDPDIYFTAKAFFQVNAYSTLNSALTAESMGIVAGDIVHNGMISTYRSANPNWATYKPHSINIAKSGIVTEDDTYDGYEVNFNAGLIRLNESVRVDLYTVKGTYQYVPVGLYIEDVLRDLLIEPDALVVNKVTNPNFNQGTTSWVKHYGGGVTETDYTLSVSDGLKIATTRSLLANEYVGISQSSINVLSGYTYTITAQMYQLNGSTGNVTVNFGGSTWTSGVSYFNGESQLSFTTTPTDDATVSINFQISGMQQNDEWRINNIKVTYNPAKTNAFTLSNLNCLVSIEDGNVSDYEMTKNTTYSAIPRYTTLTDTITSVTDDVIKVVSTDGFNATGILQVDSEYITYTGITSTTFTGITRAELTTTKANHDIGVRTWQVLSAGKLWYTKYSNVIPKTTNSTASAYDAINGVNIGSAGSFSITSGALLAEPKFKEFFYRQGIVIVSGTASSVVMTTNRDYYFSQLQSTGVETPYVLIDYRQLNTRFDAIQEIRSMLAPNYIISAIARTSGSAYTTYIKGRYLSQKTIQDYDLDFINSISYNTNIKNYNRVKMFGRLSNPRNLMYEPITYAIPVTSMNSEYLKGVEYTYVDTVGANCIYQLTTEKRFTNINSSLSNYIPFNTSLLIENGNTLNTQRAVTTAVGNDFYVVKVVRADIRQRPNTDTVVAGMYISTGLRYTNIGRNGSTLQSVYILNMYNVYFVNILTSTPGGAAFTYQRITDGVGGMGLAINTIYLDADSPYDFMIFVLHDKGTPLFSAGATVTTAYATATVSYVMVDGIYDQINYNSDNNQYLRYNISEAYKPINNSTDNALVITPNNIMNTVNGYKLYFNGFVNTNEPSYEQVLVPLGEKTFSNGAYHRSFGGLGVYLNNNVTEYNSHRFNLPGYDLPLGTVRIEQHTGTSRNDLVTLKYFNEPDYWYKLSEIHGTFAQQLLAGGEIAFAGYIVKTNLFDDLFNGTHIRYYKRYSLGIDWKLRGDYIYIDKAGMDASNLVASETKITVDGEFVTNLPTEYIYSPNKPLIERLRDFTRKGRDEQIGLVSRFQVSELPLVVIDLGLVKKVKYIDVQGGYLYKPSDTGDNAGYPCNFKVSIRYATKDVPFELLLDSDFYTITDDTESVEMSEGDVKSFDESQLGEYFETRYLKFFVDTGETPDIEEGLETDLTQWFGASIAGIAIYESDLIVSEQYVDADVINMYKDTTVYDQLYTQTLVDTFASARLTEFQKGITETTVQLPYSPHYEIGQTVRLNDTENVIDQNYFIEECASSNGQTTLTMAYYP